MLRTLESEIRKLYSSKIWWLIITGAVLPGVVTLLSFLDRRDISWLIFFHVALLIFNVQSLLIFSTFAAYLCAREYDENTIEVVLCYPYPKYYFLLAKLIILFFVIGITAALFAITIVIIGSCLLTGPLPADLLRHFSGVLLQSVVMHFLLMPAVFLLTVITRLAISGILSGLVGMCLCMVLYKTSFIQFIPPCIPFNLSDHLLGMDVMHIAPDYTVHWLILVITFVLFLFACITTRSDKFIRS